MTSRKPRRKRHIPQRTCVGCREVLPKRTLIRIVRDADGIHIDSSGKAPGRGAYLHDRRACWESGLRGPLARALKTELTPQARQALQSALDGLPDEA